MGVDKHETCTRTGVLEKAIALCHRIISTSTFSSHAKARALEVQPKGTEVLPKKCCLSDKKASKQDVVSTLRDFFPQVNKEKSRSRLLYAERKRFRNEVEKVLARLLRSRNARTLVEKLLELAYDETDSSDDESEAGSDEICDWFDEADSERRDDQADAEAEEHRYDEAEEHRYDEAEENRDDEAEAESNKNRDDETDDAADSKGRRVRSRRASRRQGRRASRRRGRSRKPRGSLRRGRRASRRRGRSRK